MADPQKIKLRRGNKSDLPTLNVSEPGVTLDTKELFFGTANGNASLTNRNHVFMPINWGDKESGLPHFIQTSGSGTLVYDNTAPSAMGVGAYKITGNGTWTMDEKYACCPLLGIEGHTAIRSNSGSAVVSTGVEYYLDDETTVVGGVAQSAFIRLLVTTTSSYVLNRSLSVGEGVGNNQLPVNARWLSPQVIVASNTGEVLLDCFGINPLTFDLNSPTKYFGDPSVDGTFKITVIGSDLTVERRVSGVYTIVGGF